MATGFPVKANYATGDVLTAANMNDLSGTLNYLNGVPYNKNAVINGGFDIWQRGTSVAGSTTAFSADRWQAYRTVSGSTYSRQTTSDTTNLPNIQYCLRVQRDSGNTNTTILYLGYSSESINSIPFAGKTVTLSFYARKGTNFSASSSTLESHLMTGTGTDQNFASYTTLADNGQNNTLTTTWQRFTQTVSIGATATEFAVYFNFTPVGTASTNDYFEITGVQLELGSVATPFSRAGGTIQGELAACQRYYWRAGLDATGAYGVLGNSGYTDSSTNSNVMFNFPVHMRVAPTAIDYPTLSTTRILNLGNPFTPSAASLNGNTNAEVGWVQFTSSGMTSGQFSQFTKNNSASAYIGFTAEL